MTLRIEVAQQDVMTSRFAISPLWELTQALRSLAGPPSRDDAALRPWLIRVRDRYQRLARDVDLAVLHALQPPNWGAGLPVPRARQRVHHHRRPTRPGQGHAHRRGPA